MEFNEENSPFTTHEIKFLKDIGEYDSIMAGLEFVEKMKCFPKNIPVFLARVNKELPDNPQKMDDALNRISNDDPEFYQQIVAYTELMTNIEESPSQRIETVSVQQVKEQERAEAYDILMKKIKTL